MERSQAEMQQDRERDAKRDEVAAQNLQQGEAGTRFNDGAPGQQRPSGIEQGPGGERYHEGDDRDRFLSSAAGQPRNLAAQTSQRGPRGSVPDVEDKVEYRADFTADKALARDAHAHAALSRLCLCVLVTRNGHTVVGKSAPADSGHYDAHLGRQFAYEDALHQVWALEGYSRRDRQGA